MSKTAVSVSFHSQCGGQEFDPPLLHQRPQSFNCFNRKLQMARFPQVANMWPGKPVSDGRQQQRIRKTGKTYLLNAPMLPQFKRDADGGLTLYIQNNSPETTRNLTGCLRRRGHLDGYAPLLAERRSSKWKMVRAAVEASGVIELQSLTIALFTECIPVRAQV
jgi:hypothetical protein